MGSFPPPARPPRNPVVETLSSGSALFRVHSRRFDASSFNPTLSHRYFGGGRFDATSDDEYSYMYLGSSVSVALAETLLRDLPLEESDVRRLPRAAYKERRLSAVSIEEDIQILQLRSSQELGSVAQDTWLTQAVPLHYAQTRHWCHWIRSNAPTVGGLAWISRRDPVGAAYVLFGDRVPIGAIAPIDHPEAPRDSTTDFATPEGRARLKSLVADHGVSVTL